jgi:hypothetical protein
MCREESGGGAVSPSSTALPKDPYPGVSTPAPSLPIRWHSGLVLSLSLSLSPRLLIGGMFRLPPYRIVERIGTPCFTTATLKTLR